MPKPRESMVQRKKKASIQRYAARNAHDSYPISTMPKQVFKVYGVQDVLKYYKATLYGSGPPALGCRSPRESFDPNADGFMRERGSYQDPMEHP